MSVCTLFSWNLDLIFTIEKGHSTIKRLADDLIDILFD